MIKRVSILVLAMIMVISSVMCLPCMAQGKNTEQTSEVQILEAIGILDDDFNAKVPVERGAFAKYVARLWGEVPASNQAALIYYDVAADTDECSAISRLTSMGILNGYGDGKFKPGTPIKIQDATKVIIEILGYKYLAEVKGGYPVGYMATAQSLGLFKGVNTDRAYFYGNDFATMLYNALTADALIENGLVADGDDFSVTTQYVEGKTFLSERLNMHVNKGVITDNSVTNLVDGVAGKKQLRIDGELYDVFDVEFWDMVGCYVEYVYHQDPITNKKTIVYAIPEKDSVLTISQDDFIGLEDFTVKYYNEEGKEKKVTLSAKVEFVYNGKVTAFDDALLENFNLGTIKLINNNGGKDYEIFSIESYQSFVADGVNASQMKIDDGKNEKHIISCDPNNYDKALILSYDGKEMAFDTITKGRVISYFINDGYLKMYAISSSAEGYVSAISTLNGEEQYKINGIFYSLPKKYAGKRAEVGDYVIAYIDIFGKIANMEQSDENNLKTAFLLKSGHDGNSLSKKYGFKMYAPNNTVITLYAADKIEYNGVNVKIDDMPQLPQTVICYETNTEGLIKRIETPVERNDSYVDGRLMTVNEKERYGYYSGMLNSKITFTAEDTATFTMPDIPAGETADTFEYTEDMINCVAPKDLRDNASFIMQAYVLSKDAPVAKAVVLYESLSTSLPFGDNLATVVSINNVLDENDLEVCSATVRVEGQLKEFAFDDEVDGLSDFDILKPGATFRYGTNASGEIDKVQMVYTSQDGWLFDTCQVSPQDFIELAYGKVMSTQGKFMRVKFDDEPDSDVMLDYYALPYSHYTNVTIINETPRGSNVTYGLIQTAEVGDYIINYRYQMGGAGFVIIKRD